MGKKVDLKLDTLGLKTAQHIITVSMCTKADCVPHHLYPQTALHTTFAPRLEMYEEK